MQVGLGPGDIVLDGDPSPPKNGGAVAPHFSGPRTLANRLDGSRWHLVVHDERFDLLAVTETWTMASQSAAVTRDTHRPDVTSYTGFTAMTTTVEAWRSSTQQLFLGQPRGTGLISIQTIPPALRRSGTILNSH